MRFYPYFVKWTLQNYKFTYKMQFFVYKICTYQIKVVILHRQTNKTTQKHLEQ